MKLKPYTTATHFFDRKIKSTPQVIQEAADRWALGGKSPWAKKAGR